MDTESVGMEVEKGDSKEQIRHSIVAKLEELGLTKCPEDIVDRLLAIYERTGFGIDSEMICEGFQNVLSDLETKNIDKIKLTEKQKEEGILASFLHDIGKSGPKDSNLSERLSVIKLFSINNIKNPNQSVSDAIQTFFPDETDKMLEDLSKVGILKGDTMRSFWDKHAWWTYDILAQYKGEISDRVILVSASHHINSGINPCGISEEEVPSESVIIGALENYVDLLEERMLIALDKYQASIVRGEFSHEQAMMYLRNELKKYKDDTLMNSILDSIDELGKNNFLFPKTKEKYKGK